MKPLAYCVFVLLLLNPVIVFCGLVIGIGYWLEHPEFTIVASGALSLVWTVSWVAIRNNNARLDYECRKRMGWL